MAYVWGGGGGERSKKKVKGVEYRTVVVQDTLELTIICLRGKDGGTDNVENSSSTDSEYLIFGKSDKSQDRFPEVRHKKKRN